MTTDKPKFKTSIGPSEAAVLLGVSKRTVNKYLDTKQIEGYRQPPGDPSTNHGGCRRFLVSSVVAFAESNGIPIDKRKLMINPQLPGGDANGTD